MMRDYPAGEFFRSLFSSGRKRYVIPPESTKFSLSDQKYPGKNELALEIHVWEQHGDGLPDDEYYAFRITTGLAKFVTSVLIHAARLGIDVNACIDAAARHIREARHYGLSDQGQWPDYPGTDIPEPVCPPKMPTPEWVRECFPDRKVDIPIGRRE